MKIDLIKLFFKYYLKNKTKNENTIDIDKIENILVISNTAIGDTLFVTPALRMIKEKYPDKRVIALLNPVNYKLFESNPYIDKIFTYNGKWRSFYITMKKLRKFNIDISFIMNCNEPQATPLTYSIQSKYIIRIPNLTNEFNFLHYNPPIARNYDEHTINTRIKQLEYIGITKKSYQMELFPNKNWFNKVDNYLKKDITYIGLQLGASTVSRMWFNTHWQQLAELLLEYDKSIELILTGAPNETNLTTQLEKSLKNDRVHNFAGKFDICSAAGLIGRLRLLVTPDTGPLHIAAAMETDTVAISVAGLASSSNPISNTSKHIFIQKPKTCDPCIDKRCKYQECMLQITPEEVFENIKHILGSANE